MIVINHNKIIHLVGLHGPTSVRRFLQKNENRPKKPRKNRVNRFFIKIRSKIETTVKKDTTRYSVLVIKCKVFVACHIWHMQLSYSSKFRVAVYRVSAVVNHVADS
jgi:hypothetical protein